MIEHYQPEIVGNISTHSFGSGEKKIKKLVERGRALFFSEVARKEASGSAKKTRW